MKMGRNGNQTLFLCVRTFFAVCLNLLLDDLVNLKLSFKSKHINEL